MSLKNFCKKKQCTSCTALSRLRILLTFEKLCTKIQPNKSDIVLTDEREEHIQKRHPEDYKKYKKYLSDIINYPDYILKDMDNKDTILVLKTIKEGKSNSILTFFHLRERTFKSTIKNNQIIFNKLDKSE